MMELKVGKRKKEQEKKNAKGWVKGWEACKHPLSDYGD